MPRPVNVKRALPSRDLRVALAVSAVASIGVLSTSNATQPARVAAQVRGDLRAWDEIVSAYEALRALPGWRERVTSQGKEATIREVVPPESSRSLTQGPSGSVETITVGRDMRYRISAPGVLGDWICLPMPAGSLADPSDADGNVEAARGSDTTINGKRVRTYTYAWTPAVQKNGHSETGMVAIYVDAQTGLPRRFAATFPSGSQTIDYHDYGANITITLPHCGRVKD